MSDASIHQEAAAAVLEAAKALGEDGRGGGGFAGYFRRLEALAPSKFADIVAKQLDVAAAAPASPYEDIDDDALAEIGRKVEAIAGRFRAEQNAVIQCWLDVLVRGVDFTTITVDDLLRLDRCQMTAIQVARDLAAMAGERSVRPYRDWLASDPEIQFHGVVRKWSEGIAVMADDMPVSEATIPALPAPMTEVMA